MALEVPYSYSYPTHKTGTAQDLMSVVTRAYEVHLERTKTALPAKSDWQRWLLEAPFAVLGLGVSLLLELLPAETVLRFHSWLFNALSSPHRYAFREGDEVLKHARELHDRVAAETGQAPALLALISHPPVLGDLAHLNFALVRHAMLAMRAARGAPCKPRLLVATDFFALDTIPVYQEGLYSGFMGTYHLGFDRLSVSRNPMSRCLLRRTAWDRTPLRLLRLLGAGKEAGMVLAGGVPSTTRILYAVREWLGEVRRASALKGRPAEVLRRLRQSADFARFEDEAPLGERLKVSAWRMAEAWAMAALAGVFVGANGTESAADSGKLPDSARGRLLDCLSAFGLDGAEGEKALAALSEELRRETPYRARFFRVLAGRVLKAGRPIVFVPVAHRLTPEVGVEVHEAWAWRGLSGGSVKGWGPQGRAWEGTAEEFACAFGRENFK
ncbi:MAG: hypothetical protein HY077_15565 [Elusimicrobia bacterium]|nr:hypothetical protein [Elusimicrobiota bacterium]